MLFHVIILASILSFSVVTASDDINFKQPTAEDIKLAQDLYINSIKILAEDEAVTGIKDNKYSFYVFVSFGLGQKNIEELASLASEYHGILVVRGFKDSSFIKTASFAKEIGEKITDLGFVIDPTLFTKYSITKVPSFVLAKEQFCPANTTCPNIYDKVVGNINPEFALQKFAKFGDLKDEARRLLTE